MNSHPDHNIFCTIILIRLTLLQARVLHAVNDFLPRYSMVWLRCFRFLAPVSTVYIPPSVEFFPANSPNLPGAPTSSGGRTKLDVEGLKKFYRLNYTSLKIYHTRISKYCQSQSIASMYMFFIFLVKVLFSC